MTSASDPPGIGENCPPGFCCPTHGLQSTGSFRNFRKRYANST
jgi:hypothetical protein